MDYEQRMRLRSRLQRLGLPAILDELIRLAEALDLLTDRLTHLESASVTWIAPAAPPAPIDDGSAPDDSGIRRTPANPSLVAGSRMQSKSS